MTTPDAQDPPADPPPGAERFTIGLMVDVARMLEQHGYPPLTAARDLLELQVHLFHFLHGDPAGTCWGGAR
jgi:hypothetical protein